MIKAFLVLMVLLVPFFSKANIFVDAETKSPDQKLMFCISATWASTTENGCGETEHEAKMNACALTAASHGKMADSTENWPHREYSDPYCDFINNDYDFYHNETVTYKPVDDIQTVYGPDPKKITGVNFSNNLTQNNQRTCPPLDFPTFTYAVDFDGDDEPEQCADPDIMPLYDSCNVNDSPNLQVTEQNACYTKSDGSKCSVTAVDVGGGNQVYMGSEGNCYAEPKPDVSGNSEQGEPNPDGTCTNNGGLLACPEDPDNVCGETGSNYGGGSVNNCQSGCGYVNDTFTCYDTDIDSDGLPDYNDPDKDGDGIPNDEDLDSDGDGKDDPINSGDGTSSGNGSNVDVSQVVSELQKLNKNFDKLTDFKDFDSDNKIEELNNDYKNKLEDFIAKGSEELGYTDVLVLSNVNALSSIPTNTCQPYSINVRNYNATFDICPAAERAKPILSWLIGMLTAWHIFTLINLTLREGI